MKTKKSSMFGDEVYYFTGLSNVDVVVEIHLILMIISNIYAGKSMS